MQQDNGFVTGQSPPWPPTVARGISAEQKWLTLLEQAFENGAPDFPLVTKGSLVRHHRLVDLVNARDLTDAQKWLDICAELELPPWEQRNVGDVMYSLATGWRPGTV
jgi:hypothetical protein